MKIKGNITVILENGDILSTTKGTDEMYKEILTLIDSNDEEGVRCLVMPEFCKKQEEIQDKISLMENFEQSAYLTVKGQSVYLLSVSELTLPEDLALAIWKAEENEDEDLIETYINFWTLASLNPDSRARTNLFWFLNRYGMTISKSGLFVAYRNVVLKTEGSKISVKWAKFITDSFTKVKFRLKKSPKNYYLGKDFNGDKICTTSLKKIKKLKGTLSELYMDLADVEVAPVFTDGYTKTFTIKIGEPVLMERDKCDSTQENTCSRGLHVAGKAWLNSNYFGDTGLRVLVNPTDVVAVPPEDSYGKMRVCAYYPIAIVNFGKDGKIIDEEIKDGFEDNFMEMIAYQGDINKEDLSSYTLDIPTIPELSRKRIMNRLSEISLTLKNKVDED